MAAQSAAVEEAGEEGEAQLEVGHASTLQTKMDLLAKINSAAQMVQQRELPAARAMYEEVLEEQKQTVGPNHANTLETKVCLANVMWIQGQSPAARAMYEEVLEAQEETLGPDHPNTLTTKAMLEALARGEEPPMPLRTEERGNGCTIV